MNTLYKNNGPYSENMKSINTLCGQNVGIMGVKAGYISSYNTRNYKKA
jgi:hypothetical protein